MPAHAWRPPTHWCLGETAEASTEDRAKGDGMTWRTSSRTSWPVRQDAIGLLTRPGSQRLILRSINDEMTVADAPNAEQRQWLTHINQRQRPGGHVHMITADRLIRPAGPVPGQPPPGHEPTEPAQQPGQDIKAVLGSLTRQISRLESDNDRLRRDNDRLRAQVKHLRSQVQALGGQVARHVGELLASTGD